MTRFLVCATVFAALIVAAVVLGTSDSDAAATFYGEKIRASLFTGLLTVGSFLLSLKVFIVVKFKETVFDSKEYKERLAERRKIDPTLEHYAQVRNLSQVLFLAIASAIAASVSQITVGLIHHWGALLFCVFVAAFAAAMLVQTLVLIRKILTEWLDYMEEKPEGEQ